MCKTIKEYLLEQDDDFKYEIRYYFICPNATIFDYEYSSGMSTAGEFKKEVKENYPTERYSHYRDYSFVYDEFYIDEVTHRKGNDEQEIIIITVDSEDDEDISGYEKIDEEYAINDNTYE